VSAESEALSHGRARAMRRATRGDLVHAGILLALATVALSSGHAAARHLSPGGARVASSLLDDLELPTALPNATLTTPGGPEARLWDLTRGPRTVLTFYAPWCGPCQEELPMLVAGTSDQPERLVVVVGADEDPAEVRTKLDNLGLKDLPFHVDARRELAGGARVTALPTTFLLGPAGRVRDRIVGYSGFRVQMLAYRAGHDDAD